MEDAAATRKIPIQRDLRLSELGGGGGDIQFR